MNGKINSQQRNFRYFGFYVASGDILNSKLAEAGDKVLPSVFMPPCTITLYIY